MNQAVKAKYHYLFTGRLENVPCSGAFYTRTHTHAHTCTHTHTHTSMLQRCLCFPILYTKIWGTLVIWLKNEVLFDRISCVLLIVVLMHDLLSVEIQFKNKCLDNYLLNLNKLWINQNSLFHPWCYELVAQLKQKKGPNHDTINTLLHRWEKVLCCSAVFRILLMTDSLERPLVA